MAQVRQRWTDEDIGTLKSMATKYPRAEIASELGLKASSIQWKAFELGISVRFDRRQQGEQDVR
jgi:hypothetical protein